MTPYLLEDSLAAECHRDVAYDQAGGGGHDAI